MIKWADKGSVRRRSLRERTRGSRRQGPVADREPLRGSDFAGRHRPRERGLALSPVAGLWGRHRQHRHDRIGPGTSGGFCARTHEPSDQTSCLRTCGGIMETLRRIHGWDGGPFVLSHCAQRSPHSRDLIHLAGLVVGGPFSSCLPLSKGPDLNFVSSFLDHSQ